MAFGKVRGKKTILVVYYNEFLRGHSQRIFLLVPNFCRKVNWRQCQYPLHICFIALYVLFYILDTVTSCSALNFSHYISIYRVTSTAQGRQRIQICSCAAGRGVKQVKGEGGLRNSQSERNKEFSSADTGKQMAFSLEKLSLLQRASAGANSWPNADCLLEISEDYVLCL